MASPFEGIDSPYRSNIGIGPPQRKGRGWKGKGGGGKGTWERREGKGNGREGEGMGRGREGTAEASIPSKGDAIYSA